jgi:hypothetical protein
MILSVATTVFFSHEAFAQSNRSNDDRVKASAAPNDSSLVEELISENPISEVKAEWQLKRGERYDLEYRPPLFDLLKYDTSRENPEHRCYEFIQPISHSYNFVFKFILMEKFTTGGAR